MPYNQKEILKYLYYNDTGEYLSLNEIIKAHGYTDEDSEDLKNSIGALSIHERIETIPTWRDVGDKAHISRLGNNRVGTIVTIENTPIMARITTGGRQLYIQAYLEQDRDEKQDVLSRSILTTNCFIKLTFGAVAAGIILQAISIYVMHEDAKVPQQVLPQAQKTEHQLMPLQEVKIYPHDSIQMPKPLKEKK